MSNWTVTINKEEYEFDMFSEAVKMMKTAIKQHICINTDVFNTEAWLCLFEQKSAHFQKDISIVWL